MRRRRAVQRNCHIGPCDRRHLAVSRQPTRDNAVRKCQMPPLRKRVWQFQCIPGSFSASPARSVHPRLAGDVLPVRAEGLRHAKDTSLLVTSGCCDRTSLAWARGLWPP
jgi:hypothetical protein